MKRRPVTDSIKSSTRGPSTKLPPPSPLPSLPSLIPVRSSPSFRSIMSSNTQHWQTMFTSQTALCTLPIAVLVVIASLDAADKQLLASSFPMLEKTLGLSVDTLGYFSLFTNGSYALSLPLWGYLVHRYGLANIHVLLGAACASWGVATIGIAVWGHSIVGQAIFRALVGVALGSILPLSQTLLVELVAVEMRGRAFGLMLLCEKLAGTLAAASVVYLDVWETPYYALGSGSILMGYFAGILLSPSARTYYHPLESRKKEDDEEDGIMASGSASADDAPPALTLRQIIQRIVRLPAFVCMVAQGIFGGTPWDMMSFLLLLMDWRGFTNAQIVSIQFTSGLTSTVGGWLGGYLGDYLAARHGTHGRIALALVSVVGGIPFYGMYLYATNYHWALLWINAFQLWGTWTQPGALRPICADLTRNPSERAQIVSLWIVLEKISGAVFGAPLVGYLTSHMLQQQHHNGNDNGDGDGQDFSSPHTPSTEKAQALAFNLFLLSTLFWSICAFFWVVMAVVIPKEEKTMMMMGGGGGDDATTSKTYRNISSTSGDDPNTNNLLLVAASTSQRPSLTARHAATEGGAADVELNSLL